MVYRSWLLVSFVCVSVHLDAMRFAEPPKESKDYPIISPRKLSNRMSAGVRDAAFEKRWSEEHAFNAIKLQGAQIGRDMRNGTASSALLRQYVGEVAAVLSQDTEVWARRLDACVALSSVEKKLKDVKTFLEDKKLDPELSSYVTTLFPLIPNLAGCIAVAHEDYSAAEKYFKRGHEEYQDPFALRNLADLLASRGKRSISARYYKKYERIISSIDVLSARDRNRYALFYLYGSRRGKQMLFPINSERAMDYAASDAEGLLIKSEICWRQADKEASLKNAEEALSAGTRDPYVHNKSLITYAGMQYAATKKIDGILHAMKSFDESSALSSFHSVWDQSLMQTLVDSLSDSFSTLVAHQKDELRKACSLVLAWSSQREDAETIKGISRKAFGLIEKLACSGDLKAQDVVIEGRFGDSSFKACCVLKRLITQPDLDKAQQQELIRSIHSSIEAGDICAQLSLLLYNHAAKKDIKHCLMKIQKSPPTMISSCRMQGFFSKEALESLLKLPFLDALACGNEGRFLLAYMNIAAACNISGTYIEKAQEFLKPFLDDKKLGKNKHIKECIGLFYDVYGQLLAKRARDVSETPFLYPDEDFEELWFGSIDYFVQGACCGNIQSRKALAEMVMERLQGEHEHRALFGCMIESGLVKNDSEISLNQYINDTARTLLEYHETGDAKDDEYVKSFILKLFSYWTSGKRCSDARDYAQLLQKKFTIPGIVAFFEGVLTPEHQKMRAKKMRIKHGKGRGGEGLLEIVKKSGFTHLKDIADDQYMMGLNKYFEKGYCPEVVEIMSKCPESHVNSRLWMVDGYVRAKNYTKAAECFACAVKHGLFNKKGEARDFTCAVYLAECIKKGITSSHGATSTEKKDWQSLLDMILEKGGKAIRIAELWGTPFVSVNIHKDYVVR